MTILQNTLTEPDGTLLDGWLSISLVGSPFRPATQSEVLGLQSQRVSGGFWPVELAPGQYEVLQRRIDGTVYSRWSVTVPAAEAPVWLGDCLVTSPSAPG